MKLTSKPYGQNDVRYACIRTIRMWTSSRCRPPAAPGVILDDVMARAVAHDAQHADVGLAVVHASESRLTEEVGITRGEIS